MPDARASLSAPGTAAATPHPIHSPRVPLRKSPTAPAESLAGTQLSKSQVGAMAIERLDEQFAAFRNGPLDAGPYAFVWADALTRKVREAEMTSCWASR
jgi:Transposase, Mutator family